MSNPKVVLIVGPRERFSSTQTSLESIYNDTDYPFDLIYVDVCSPAPIRRYLEEQSRLKQFTLLHTDDYVSPTQAKNVGLRHVLSHAKDQYQYVVFIENDVIVKRGWLTKLVECAEETGAAVVGPLTCIGKPAHQVIHNAGGKSYITTEIKNGQTRRYIYQSAALTGKAVTDVADKLRRKKTDYVEFHCMLVRTQIFDQIGLLDEGMLATREHIDFCFMVTQAGGSIYSERQAIVTTDTIGIETNQAGLVNWFGDVQLPDFKWFDLPYFMLRWNDAWDLASLHHLRQKWNLTEDEYFQKRYKKVGARRHELLIKPIVRRLTFGKGSPWLENLLIAIERPINRYMYHRYLQRQSKAPRQWVQSLD
ncbi:MAG: glycosyltransferase [Synechococcales cyanobacterium C42_A2020_086]|nr:glycosyltransferase [Synechococcales cyanobacterium M58_A2018_015]MBF2073075.1 glycosyltransferase [Synechococcales cyanobacterium C42_A2020_086]